MNSCCGKKRAMASTMFNQGTTESAANTQTGNSSVSRIVFQYLGGRSLSVMGPVSGQMYHFVGHGARVAVDSRDRRSLANITGLRQLAG